MWNEVLGCFERIDHFKMVHDHRIELDERCFLPNQLMRDIKHYVMDKPDVQCSEIIRKINLKHNKKLRHLEVLNALKVIKGDVKLDLKVLTCDLDLIKSKHLDAHILLNDGTPIVVFI
jgi:hypothetical protein